MSNYIHKLWPVEYWRNKKRQFMAGSAGNMLWPAGTLGALAILFAISVIAGIMTAKPFEEAQQIPLRPLTQELNLPAGRSEDPPLLNVTKPVEVKQQPPPVKAESPSQWPVNGDCIHAYGWQQHPTLQDWRYHTGVDLSAELGQPVAAAMGGTVVAVSQDPKTGLTVKIASGSWLVQHGSLNAATVKEGEQVAAGQVIGAAGESFQEPYPHVHLVIEKDGKHLNPADILPPR